MNPKTGQVFNVNMDETVETMPQFQLAIANAQGLGIDSIEVSENVFNAFARAMKHPSDFFTYGQPGVKVYKTGTREILEKKQRLTTFDVNKGTPIDKLPND